MPRSQMASKSRKSAGRLYIENLAVALDKKSPKDPKSLLDAITKAVTDMHSGRDTRQVVDEVVQALI